MCDMFLLDELVCFKEVVSTWEGFEDYVPRLEYLIKNSSKLGSKCYKRNKPGFGYNVLNHGDFHSRNLLTKFNSDTNRLEKFQFVID
jgi:hypothetical protein